MPADSHDVIVVGGSFAGLSAAMQLARARRRVLILDTGLPRNRFAHASQGFFGQDGRAPAAILETARGQVLAYPTAKFRHDEATRAAARDDGTFEVTLASGGTTRARRLVLATGVVDELPEIPGLRERWGKSVLHCPYCHGFEVADGRLGVLAVGEHSLHQALLLPDWSGDVTLFTNGSVEPTAEQGDKLAARGVRIEARPVAELLGDGASLAGLRLRGRRGHRARCALHRLAHAPGEPARRAARLRVRRRRLRPGDPHRREEGDDGSGRLRRGRRRARAAQRDVRVVGRRDGGISAHQSLALG